MKNILFALIILLGEGKTMANQLKNSLSPYLLQHKDNPVNWYEWRDEAFNKAKKENKLIFLSIGYSTCHWCHVMEHESFEDQKVAELLNKYYISIKVDKEQMPHIDNYYQLGYRIVNKRGGGWPLTVILTPDKKPIFFGTYIPKNSTFNMQGLLKILDFFAHHDRKELDKSGESIKRAIESYQSVKQIPQKVDDRLVEKTIKEYEKNFDFKYKGFSDQPKFPQSSSIDALLYLYQLSRDKKPLEMATDTLTAMAKGGIYDQIDGAFYRYSVDRAWEVPHFEKMLYTNAELLSTYAMAYKITKNPLFKRVIDETIKEIDRRFKYNGVYFSASNADSPNKNGHEIEGYFFVYDYDKTMEYLLKNNIDKKDAKEALKYFGISEYGNFKLEWSNPHITTDKKPKELERVKSLLKKMREEKEYPFIDKKINTAWNALYIKALFECGYIKKAKESLEALLNLMYKDDELYHQTLLPHKPTQKGLLEDYSFVGDALWSGYQATLDDRYLKLFEKIVYKSVEKFYKNGKWRESQDDFVTYASIEDNNYKSELSTNLENLLKLSAIKGDFKLQEMVKKTIENYSMQINKFPHYYPSALKVVLMMKYDAYFIKGKKEGLLEFDLSEIEYPFVYKEVLEQKDFLICGLTNCFKIVKSTKEILKEIEKILINK